MKEPIPGATLVAGECACASLGKILGTLSVPIPIATSLGIIGLILVYTGLARAIIADRNNRDI